MAAEVKAGNLVSEAKLVELIRQRLGGNANEPNVIDDIKHALYSNSSKMYNLDVLSCLQEGDFTSHNISQPFKRLIIRQLSKETSVDQLGDDVPASEFLRTYRTGELHPFLDAFDGKTLGELRKMSLDQIAKSISPPYDRSRVLYAALHPDSLGPAARASELASDWKAWLSWDFDTLLAVACAETSEVAALMNRSRQEAEAFQGACLATAQRHLNEAEIRAMLSRKN